MQLINLVLAMNVNLGILGGGVSGLTFANLVRKSEVLEKGKEFGGLMRSSKEQDYTFDLGSHIVFSRNKEVLSFILDLLKDNKIKHKRNTKILYKGKLVKYPFENGLGDLSRKEALDCFNSYQEAYEKRENGELKKPENFKEWMYYRFGKAITEKYLYPYNLKLWDYPPEKMDLFWVEGRIPQPPLEDVKKAAMGQQSEGYKHQLYFYYPLKGGFQSITDALQDKIEKTRLINNFEVTKVKKEDNKFVVSGPQEKIYDQLISTIHLKDFIDRYEDSPKEVKDAANNLKWNSIHLVMLGIKKPKINDFHWLYLPDKEILPNRISFPSNYSPYNAPEGHSSVLAEITFDPKGKKSKLSEREVVERTIDDMDSLKLLNRDDIIFKKYFKIDYAYVVYDLEYQKNMKTIQDFVKKEGITLLGRFSEFRYYNSDKCIESAMEKAKSF